MKIFIFTLVLFFSINNFAEENKVFNGFWENASESFTKNASYHLAAIALTPVLIHSDVDANIHTAFKGNGTHLFDPGDALGYIGPLVLGIPLYTFGKTFNNKKAIIGSFAVVQTTVITLSTVTILKGITGRHPPRNHDSKSPEWQSRQFYFGVLNRGIFTGWPSGHMASVTALASTMIHYYPEVSWVKYAGYGSMAYLLATISIRRRGQMHWFSDGVAGGFIGYAIGKTVGTNMLSQFSGQKVVENGVNILPILAPETMGIKFVWTH